MTERLANGVRDARLRLGLSQQELAARVGISRQALSSIEAGAAVPSTAVALRLAAALGCRVEDLFWLEEEPAEIQAELVVPGAGTLSTGAATAPSPAVPPGTPVRCAVARVGGRWIAYALHGEHAFAGGLLPADGLARPAGDAAGRWRVRLLNRPPAPAGTVVIAGCAPELALWARAAEARHPGLRVVCLPANSVTALELLRRGAVHVAGVHLGAAAAPGAGGDTARDAANAAAARRLLGDRRAVLIRLGVWEEGLLVAAGNPLDLRAPPDLARPGVAIVNREPGAGCRLLLEQALAAAGVPAGAVAGFDRIVPGHREVARAVASGTAAAGVSTGPVAAAYGLGFIPWRAVAYDLVVPADFLVEPAVQALLGALGDRGMRAQLEALGFDTRQTGSIVARIPGGDGRANAES